MRLRNVPLDKWTLEQLHEAMQQALAEAKVAELAVTKSRLVYRDYWQAWVKAGGNASPS